MQSSVPEPPALKHQAILYSIDRLEIAVNKVEDLLSRIAEGTGVPRQETDEVSPSTLSYMLGSAADCIEKQTARLHNAVSNLEDVLF